MKRMKRLSKEVMKGSVAVMVAATMLVTPVYADALPSGAAIPTLVEKTTSSVVAIIGRPSDDKKISKSDRYQLAHGTGVIVRADGYIVTNAHVVKNMRNLTIVTSDGRSYSGKTTHFDEESDLALVKIEANGLTPASFASSSEIHVGESVMAIGTPLSFALRNSVTSGIISGMERSVQSKYRLIQTDAAINPGNSGGALVNMKGEVIGINTMKYVEYGVDSLGFAIPVDTVQYVLDQFFKYGKVKRPTLSLELAESWEAVVGLPNSSGLEVTYVEPDSTAAKAGIKQGDTLLSINSAQIHNMVEYNEALKKYLPGDKVQLKLQSGTDTKSLDLVLGEDTSGSSNVVQDSDGSYIDADQGKTMIGDSHFGWSMKYPSGLVKTNQSATGDNILFEDAKGDYAINIRIQEKQSKDLSPLGLLRKLDTQSMLDTILEKRYVNEGPGTQPYAKVVGENSSGMYYQSRAFLKGDKIYYAILFVNTSDSKNSAAQRNSIADVLDSFSLQYDEKNSSLKDISVYQDKNTVSTEYGLTFELPQEWSKREYFGSNDYENKDGDQTISVQVSSAASGDTLVDWAARQEEEFKNTYVDEYREIQGTKEMTIGGAPAIQNLYSWTMGDKWKQAYVIYIIKDKYKYELSMTYPKASSIETIEKQIADWSNSIQFPKEAMNRSLSIIQDEDDLIDPERKVTFTNNKYGYSVQLPELWFDGGIEGSSDTASKFFAFEGGSLSVSADDRSSLEEVLNRTEQEYKKNAENDANYKYTETDESMFDIDVKKFAVQYKSKNVPYTLNEYVLAKNGIVYTIRLRINDAVKTDKQWQRLNDALHSVTFSTK
ncbi:trypsin-like peptidase domain-containing protein [Paenibacillus sp. UNC451MF]|uniref:trypsin-like peptidase domain-containing protein n=1 Tax=Paenibacillus sp. UNC451MF TaxID=1449063 RepID=UPI00048EB580|nr:trypsin-like peptidase domain-containing protein [Paenibacillus sp. UNC451MF]